jgi:hypothetical protein
VVDDGSGLYNPESDNPVRIIKSGLHQYRGRSHLFWLSLCFRADSVNVFGL